MNLDKLKELLHSGDETNIELAKTFHKDKKTEAAFNSYLKKVLKLEQLYFPPIQNLLVETEIEIHIGYIPREIYIMTQLKSIYIRWLTKPIPKRINKLVNLEKIKIDTSDNTGNIPLSLSKLPKLKEFILYESELECFPEAIIQSEKLEKLVIATAKKIEYIPESIRNLTNLYHLCLSTNQIKELPEAIGNLNKLKKLELSRNQLKALPESIVHLTELEKLDLTENLFETIPQFIGELSNLKNLNLNDNSLKELPESIKKLNKLILLSICNNNFTDIPSIVWECKELALLYISGNDIKKVSKRIKELKELRYFIAYDTLISERDKKKLKQWLPKCEFKFYDDTYYHDDEDYYY